MVVFVAADPMNQRFHVSIESPQSGWVSLSLKAGDREFVDAMSHQPYDSLNDLIRGLTALVGDRRPFTVRWNREPEEYDFRVEAAGDEVDLRVVRYQNHRRLKGQSREVFALRAPLHDFVIPFWKELRQLRRRSETDVYEQNWRRPFPHDELREFNRAVKALKRERGPAPSARQT